jgi:hypothetical protein
MRCWSRIRKISQGREENPKHRKKKERLIEMVASCSGNAVYSTLLRERQNGREEEKEDVSSYWLTITLKRSACSSNAHKNTLKIPCNILCFVDRAPSCNSG